VIYVALFAALRVFGKREVGQFTLYDLVLVLLVANAVQPAMTGPDTSLVGGVVIIAVLVLLNFIVARLDDLPLFHRLFASPPTTIIEDGTFLLREMRRQGLLREECETAIREHGLGDVSEVKLGVLEPDGNISIIGKDEKAVTTRRRRRFLRKH